MGTVVGPGTVNLNAGIIKAVCGHRTGQDQSGGLVYQRAEPPESGESCHGDRQLSVGQITSARPADFGGNRTGQVGARIEF